MGNDRNRNKLKEIKEGKGKNMSEPQGSRKKLRVLKGTKGNREERKEGGEKAIIKHLIEDRDALSDAAQHPPIKFYQ